MQSMIPGTYQLPAHLPQNAAELCTLDIDVAICNTVTDKIKAEKQLRCILQHISQNTNYRPNDFNRLHNINPGAFLATLRG